MIDHVSITVRDLARATTLYVQLLAPLGLIQLVTRDGTAGFGKRYPEFWLNARPAAPIDANNRERPEIDAVRRFQRAIPRRDGATRSIGFPLPIGERVRVRGLRPLVSDVPPP